GKQAAKSIDGLDRSDRRTLSSLITALENDNLSKSMRADIVKIAKQQSIPVLGITGTGGSGKSSLTDELIRRFRLGHADSLRIAIIAVDPTRRKTGGSLLGDRIRMNAINHENIYMRSIATRDSVGEIPDVVSDVIAACKLYDFDFIIVETPGIGQGDAAIVPLVDASLYVMTPEFGAQSQLEKIDMLDFADV
ncbi:MAG: methylmalonyl-CoA mutase, partial [bacterium]|nr:methylmalonyl-CoA mutase [bacterium]